MLPQDFTNGFINIYKRICRDGRGEQLFGATDMTQLKKALDIGAGGSPSPYCYWEFPLSGEAGLDILVGNRTNNGVLSIVSQDYPYRSVYEAASKHVNINFSYGLEWDLSSQAESLEPGFYIDHAGNDALVVVVLQALGIPERLASVQELFAKLPQNWKRYYLGLFPNRTGTPIRLGFSLNQKVLAVYRQEPARLEQDLLNLGFTAFTEAMLQEILHPIFAPFSWELQLDIFPDGSLGQDLGISYFFNNGSSKASPEYFHTDTIQNFLQYLESKGWVDARWQLLPECLFSIGCFGFNEDQLARLATQNRVNALKLKWRNGKALQAKFYFESRVVAL